MRRKAVIETLATRQFIAELSTGGLVFWTSVVVVIAAVVVVFWADGDVEFDGATIDDGWLSVSLVRSAA
jgi:hypothetical protein